MFQAGKQNKSICRPATSHYKLTTYERSGRDGRYFLLLHLQEVSRIQTIYAGKSDSLPPDPAYEDCKCQSPYPSSTLSFQCHYPYSLPNVPASLSLLSYPEQSLLWELSSDRCGKQSSGDRVLYILSLHGHQPKDDNRPHPSGSEREFWQIHPAGNRDFLLHLRTK